MKNTARLPRTAGLRTLTELTSELTKAGLDPSRIQERAEMLAKVHGAKRKRARDEDGDEEMDVDGDEDAGEGEWMDVDDDAATPSTKRAKANSGAAISKSRRAPQSNRQLAGMRDEAVSTHIPLRWVGARSLIVVVPLCSKLRKPSSCGIWARESGTTTRRRERPTVRSRPRWYVSICAASNAVV